MNRTRRTRRPTRREVRWTIGMEPQARMRLDHAGRWVAWSVGGQTIVAAADDFEAVQDAAKKSGHMHPVVEFIPSLDGV